MSKIVIALGGNALGKTPLEQLNLVKNTAKSIVKIVKEGNEVVIAHGNGPQVGIINLAFDTASSKGETPSMPFAECGAMSQGYIGYHLQQAIQEELKKEGISKNCVTIITQVKVLENDEAFKNPTKPIGMFYTKEESEKIANEKGFIFKEDAGRGYRRVVASPKPVDIVELDVVEQLVDNGTVVITVGGGGIPVIKKGNGLEGVPAVIDKDRTAALLAKLTMADTLMILTAVEKVSLNYNTENQVDLDVITIKDANKYISENQFAKGSMLPKVEASMSFVEDSDDRKAIISSLEKANLAIKGKTGTIIKRR